jgi:hypothetical protein
MKQSVYRWLEKRERMDTAVRQAEARYAEPSGAELMQALVTGYGAEQGSGESRAETLARAAGISPQELKVLLSERAHADDPELEPGQ